MYAPVRRRRTRGIWRGRAVDARRCRPGHQAGCEGRRSWRRRRRPRRGSCHQACRQEDRPRRQGSRYRHRPRRQEGGYRRRPWCEGRLERHQERGQESTRRGQLIASTSTPPRHIASRRVCAGNHGSPMSEATDTLPAVDENKLIAERREKLQALRAQGVAFPNDFQVADFAGDLQAAFADAEAYPAEALEASARRVKVAGRMVLKRVQGKVSFAQLQDFTGRIQLFVRQGTLAEDVYTAFKGWDVGDIVGA